MVIRIMALGKLGNLQLISIHPLLYCVWSLMLAQYNIWKCTNSNYSLHEGTAPPTHTQNPHPLTKNLCFFCCRHPLATATNSIYFHQITAEQKWI